MDIRTEGRPSLFELSDKFSNFVLDWLMMLRHPRKHVVGFSVALFHFKFREGGFSARDRPNHRLFTMINAIFGIGTTIGVPIITDILGFAAEMLGEIQMAGFC